ncbi:hypothetical protein R1flu_021009 [Riccia fluitans]|uniref:Ribosomal protein S14 n=1 Tax=Riccia fluitans TaxID=41844 RepID=A0ABD1ZQ52_9MARC
MYQAEDILSKARRCWRAWRVTPLTRLGADVSVEVFLNTDRRRKAEPGKLTSSCGNGRQDYERLKFSAQE